MHSRIKNLRIFLYLSIGVLGVLASSIFIEKIPTAYAVEKEVPLQTEELNTKVPSLAQPENSGPLNQPDMKSPSNTLTEGIPSSPKEADPKELQSSPQNSLSSLQLIALITEDSQPIEKGLLWRIFSDDGTEAPPSTPLLTERSASPILQMKPGNYIINVSFGRAHLTRPITVSPGSGTTPLVEKFVLNAGGLRVNALLSGKPAPAGSVSYSIYTDRDQSDERSLIVAGAKTDLVMRLNAGIYYIESIYGDANAEVRSDVTVEAGKLTEVTISHSFAKISFKLVTMSGGDALPNTRWSIQTSDGTVVKESVGALPSHTLAPGTYTVIARNQDKAFKKDFKVQDGRNEEIEIILQ